MEENALHFGSAKVYKSTIHPRCGNCHYNHTGILKHLRCRKRVILLSARREPGRTMSNASGRVYRNRAPSTSIGDGSENIENYHSNSKT